MDVRAQSVLAGVAASISIAFAINVCFASPVGSVETFEPEIGRLLFSSKLLSGNGDQACASCHMPSRRFQDGYERALSGNKTLTRNTPTLLNVNRYSLFAWDGKGQAVEDQARFALLAPQEMRANPDSIQRGIKSTSVIEQAFIRSGVDMETFVVKSISAYVRTLATVDTKYDAWTQGNAKLTNAEIRGKDIFFGKAGCISCHKPPNFTDNSFHKNGMWPRLTVLQTAHNPGADYSFEMGTDYGRGDVEPGIQNLRAFRTPSLYNVAISAPYMHDGSLPTLLAVIDSYDRGGDDPSYPLARLNLTREDKDDLVAFLKTLTDSRFADGL